jgi:hypothetical protein
MDECGRDRSEDECDLLRPRGIVPPAVAVACRSPRAISDSVQSNDWDSEFFSKFTPTSRHGLPCYARNLGWCEERTTIKTIGPRRGRRDVG